MNIIIIGAGLAGFWSAVSAGLELKKTPIVANKINIIVISPEYFLDLRALFYKIDSEFDRIPLQEIFDILHIEHVSGIVIDIDSFSKTLIYQQNTGEASSQHTINYNKLILAAGAKIKPLAVKGAENAFNIYDFASVTKLQKHLFTKLRNEQKEKYKLIILGAACSGIELACALANYVDSQAQLRNKVAITIIEVDSKILLNDIDAIQTYVKKVLKEKKITLLFNKDVVEISSSEVKTRDGEILPADVAVLCTGVYANPLTSFLKTRKDSFNRIYVNQNLQAEDIPDIFVVGDLATCEINNTNVAMTSYGAIAQGKIAGVNAVASLAGEALQAWFPGCHLSIIDLGNMDAIAIQYTQGLRVVCTGEKAYQMKTDFNLFLRQSILSVLDSVRASPEL